MSGPDSKPTSAASAAFPQSGDFGKGVRMREDDPVSQSPPLRGKRKSRAVQLGRPARALFEDAVKTARELKRRYRAFYDADLNGFRTTVRKAHSRVFRLKPGPKPDARIATAARERAAGATWASLYPKYIDHYSGMPEFTCALAEEGFRRKVNGYLQRRRRMRRQVTPTQQIPTGRRVPCPPRAAVE